MAEKEIYYRNAKGERFRLKGEPTQDQIDWLRQQGAEPEISPLKDFVKSSMAGITEGAFRAPLLGGDVAKLGMTLANKVRPGTFEDETVNRFGSQGWIDAFNGSPADTATGGLLAYDPQTKAGQFVKAGTSAISGAVVTGGLGSIPQLLKGGSGVIHSVASTMRPSSVAINGLAGVAAEAGTQISGNPLVGMAAGVATGSLGNMVRQGRGPNFHASLHDATKNMTENEWQSARNSLNEFRSTGSKSFTLADLPELQGRIGGNARDITNTTGGELLKDKLSLQTRRGIVNPDGSMTGDIPQLLRSAVDTLPPSDPRALAASLGKKGQSAVEAAAGPIYTARDGGLANLGNVDPMRLLAATNQQVRQPMIQGQNQGAGMQAALTKAEEALIGREATRTPQITNVIPPVLNVQALSQNVKGVRKIPAADSANPGVNIGRFQGMRAGEAAERALDQATDGGFGRVMSQYRTSLENIVDPMTRGLPGTLSNAKNADALIKELKAVPADKLMGELNTAGVTPAEALQLARVVGERLIPLPDATKALGTPDLQLRKVFDQLLEYGDPALKKPIGSKLKVADALSRLDAEHSADSTQRVLMQGNWADWLMPFATVGFRNRLGVGRKEAQAMSQLIGNPSPENLEALRRMSLLDPRAKKFVDWYTGWGGAASSSGGRE